MPPSGVLRPIPTLPNHFARRAVEGLVEPRLAAGADQVAAPGAEQIGRGADVGVRPLPRLSDLGHDEHVAGRKLRGPDELAGLVIDAEDRVAPRRRRLLVRVAGADVDSPAAGIDGRRRPHGNAAATRRVVFGRVHAPALGAIGGVQTDHAAAERVVILQKAELAAGDADHDRALGPDRRRIEPDARMLVEDFAPLDEAVAAPQCKNLAARRNENAIVGHERARARTAAYRRAPELTAVARFHGAHRARSFSGPAPFAEVDDAVDDGRRRSDADTDVE